MSVEQIFEGIATEDADVPFVYSSHRFEGTVYDSYGNPLKLLESEEERRVTFFLDAQGIAELYGALPLGQRMRVRPLPAHKFDARWARRGILIGGPLANLSTQRTLTEFSSPLRFDVAEGRTTIIQVDGGDGPWPSENSCLDYGIVAKMKRGDSLYLIAGGNSSHSTYACCDYLASHLPDLAAEFRTAPFACLISVDRSNPMARGVREKWMPVGPRVFLSYSGTDRAVVSRFAEALRRADLNPWWDQWELHPGDPIPTSIGKGVEQSDLFVIFLSPASVRETALWVETEYSLAVWRRMKGRTTVIPVMIEDCVPPTIISDLHHIDYRGVEETVAITGLIHEIRRRRDAVE